MLYQLHHQFKSRTEFVSQAEINNNDEMERFIKRTTISHPLPDDAIWMACNEKSEYFLLALGLEDKQIKFKPYEFPLTRTL